MNIFKKIFDTKKNLKNDEEINPYTSAKKEWNHHLGSLLIEKKNWQFVALVSLLLTIISISGLLIIADRSQYIPYIVNVDQLGRVSSVGPLRQINEIDERILKNTLSKFIENSRLITVDRFLQRKAIIDVYSHILGQSPAKNKISQWYNGSEKNSPIKRAEKELVSVHISDILQLTNNTWQISWKETTTDHNGELLNFPVNMKAILTTEIVPHSRETTEDQMSLNPLGIYIKDFSWSQVR